MFVLIVIGVVALIAGFVYVFNYSEKKYQVNPIWSGEKDEYWLEGITFVLVILAGVFQFITRKVVPGTGLNLNALILLAICLVLFSMRVIRLNKTTDMLVGIVFGIARFALAALVGVGIIILLILLK